MFLSRLWTRELSSIYRSAIGVNSKSRYLTRASVQCYLYIFDFMTQVYFQNFKIVFSTSWVVLVVATLKWKLNLCQTYTPKIWPYHKTLMCIHPKMKNKHVIAKNFNKTLLGGIADMNVNERLTIARTSKYRWQSTVIVKFFLIKASLRIIIILIKNKQYFFRVRYHVTEFHAWCFIIENAEILRDISTPIFRYGSRSVNVFKELECVIYNSFN